MNYKGYILRLSLRLVLLVILLLVLIDSIKQEKATWIAITICGTLFILRNTYLFIKRRFVAMDDFFEAVKYRDFSRWYPEDRGAKDTRFLFAGFNEINRTIKEINSKNEAQYVYLQKILEMVDIGIIAYNLESGDVLWSNDSLRETLDVPSFKNIRFIEKRKPDLYEAIFETYHPEAKTITLAIQNDKIKVLISDTVFQVQEDAFKLVVLQNINDTLNRNESESWKKLLSVMTHEIMNSIAPITSLSDTLQAHLQVALDDPKRHPVALEDVHAGIKTIKNRSEGLLKFAKTYRSLSKVTHLNLETVEIATLFENIALLMRPSLITKNIRLTFDCKLPKLAIEIDSYLIEQVLINLILNAIDACAKTPDAHIRIVAEKTPNRNTVIKVFDNGKGIPTDIMEQIFIPFFTSKQTGSGIGLSLCKQIMLLHKGKILVNSKEGSGTVFSLVF